MQYHRELVHFYVCVRPPRQGYPLHDMSSRQNPIDDGRTTPKPKPRTNAFIA
jgi:hypothetical protein